ncbi:hypothetical protein [Reichenbachiella sp. MALMAid0571]|uniref:hypothetical protein n=1 Tax=Reichenbachiella sp. MALMAid0571 TaxID=3143939 RepID=UPI0032E012C5
MIRGIIKIIALTLAILLVYLLLAQADISIPFGEKFYAVLIFFFIQSIIVHVLFRLGQEHLELSVPLLVMATMTIRVLTSLMFVATFIVMGVNEITNFVITFFAIYLFYFVFEIITVLSNLRTNLK